MVRPKPNVDTALSILRHNAPYLSAEFIPVSAAVRRIVATSPRAELPVPRFHASAMDGFAVSSSSTYGASAEAPVWLDLAEGTGAAGTFPRILGPSEVARIATGAPIPCGADAVLTKEYASSLMAGEDSRFFLTSPVPAGCNVRLAGEDVPAGVNICTPGKALSPAAIGLLVAAGVPHIEVRRLPRVCTISTGSELVPPTKALDHPAHIPDSNGPMLTASLDELGLPNHRHRHTIDRPGLLNEILTDQDTDVFVSTGGVSVGDFDLIPAALSEIGATIHFNGVAMRPGKPILFATLPNGTPFIGLPGNPVAAAVGFRFFFIALLRAMLGAPAEAGVPIGTSITRRAGTTLFLRGSAFHDSQGVLGVTLERDQRSHVLSSVVAADSWIRADGDEAQIPLLFPQTPSLGA